MISSALHKHRIAVCFFGVVSRSISYTFSNLQQQLLRPLQQHPLFDVDIYVFNNNVENAIVDTVPQDNTNIRVLTNIATVTHEETQTNIDNHIRDHIHSKQIQVGFRYDYTKQIIQNSLRQMYSECQVGDFLEQKPDIYDCAIVCGPDYAL